MRYKIQCTDCHEEKWQTYLGSVNPNGLGACAAVVETARRVKSRFRFYGLGLRPGPLGGGMFMLVDLRCG